MTLACRFINESLMCTRYVFHELHPITGGIFAVAIAAIQRVIAVRTMCPTVLALYL